MSDFAILIVSLVRRRPFYARLMRRLEPQLSSRVSVYTLEDTGVETIGQKRQRLLTETASQKDPPRFCAFVDDDDLVSPTYCESVLGAIDKDPDVVGFWLRHFTDGRFDGSALHSVRCQYWTTEQPPRGETLHYRPPNHLNPIRTEIALTIGYKPLQTGEDADYAMRLKKAYPNLREEFIDEYIYDYFYRTPQRRREFESMQVPDVENVT